MAFYFGVDFGEEGPPPRTASWPFSVVPTGLVWRFSVIPGLRPGLLSAVPCGTRRHRFYEEWVPVEIAGCKELVNPVRALLGPDIAFGMTKQFRARVRRALKRALK